MAHHRSGCRYALAPLIPALSLVQQGKIVTFCVADVAFDKLARLYRKNVS